MYLSFSIQYQVSNTKGSCTGTSEVQVEYRACILCIVCNIRKLDEVNLGMGRGAVRACCIAHAHGEVRTVCSWWARLAASAITSSY